MQSRVLIVFTSSPQGTVASSHQSFSVSSLGNVLLEGKGGEGCRLLFSAALCCSASPAAPLGWALARPHQCPDPASL